MKTISKIILLFLLIGLVTSCATTKSKNKKSVHGDKPLIDVSEVVVQGREDMNNMVKAGPKPYDPDFDVTANKRKTLTTENIRNYVTIPDEYGNLKQEMSINLNNVDFKYAMSLMADLGEVNILVGDEVSGTVTAKLDQVPWDIAFQTLLDMKGLGADVNVSNGIIRVHSPEKLKTQETFKSERATVLKQKIQLEESVEPILADIFRLYYISPEQAKATLEDLFSTQGAEGAATMSNVKITVEETTRSIIVRGHKPDLDVIDAVLTEIDVKTKQVLIEAFIVDVTSSFAKALGSRVGAMTETNPASDKSTTISGTVGGGGSNGALHGLTKYSMAEAPSNEFFLEYVARPQTAEIFFEEVLMACVFYGMPILVENNKPRLLYHFKNRGYRGFSMNRPDKHYTKLSKTEKELGGIPNTSEDIKQSHAAAIESHIEKYVGLDLDGGYRPGDQMGSMYFTRTLEDWARFDISARTKFDASISSGLAIMANQKHVYLPQKKESKISLNFATYNNKGTLSELIR